MRKFTVLILLLIIVGVFTQYYFSHQEPQQQEAAKAILKNQEPPMIKAVHYFSSSWPITFWGDFEKSQVDSDFAQIKADGFNTVILVVPWMGFEIGFEDGITEPSLLYERLDWLLAKIDEAGLNYGLRLSFPHSFDPAVGIGSYQLCSDVFVDSTVRDNWFQYLTRVTQLVNKHREPFKMAFFSWEDFFCPYVLLPRAGENKRLEIAKRSGYQAWLGKHYPMHLIESSYRRAFDSLEAIPIPERESPAFWLFFRFIDQFMIDQLVKPGRQILPELAMEVRVDMDKVHGGDESFWAKHDLALSDTQLRGSYWGAYYGAHDQGELLTADQALKNFEQMLNEVSDHGRNINHVVEQFNFSDNTPWFAGKHAQIQNGELPAFLEGAAKLLERKSRGYGLWAYRDYGDLAIYNSSFELGLRGWDSQGDLAVINNEDGDKALRMGSGAEISQTFAPFDRFIGLSPAEEVTFCANFTLLSGPARFTISLDGIAFKIMDIRESSHRCITMDAQSFKLEKLTFSISSDTEIQIDDVRMYSFLQKLDVYDEYNQPGPVRDLIVRLNKDWLAD